MLSAWERALQGRGGGNAAVVAARNRDAQRRLAEARVAATNARARAETILPSNNLFASSGTGRDYRIQPKTAEEQQQSRDLAEFVLFGPERSSALGGEASRPERFVRDWGLSEQEFRLAGESAREGNLGSAAGWATLGLAGVVPIFGDLAQGLARAGRASRLSSAAGDVSRAMPSGPPPTPPTRSWDPWSSDPMPEGWTPLSSTGRPLQKRPTSDEYFAELEARQQAVLARKAEQARQAAEAERIKKAEETRLELEALRSLERALVAPTTPQLPRVSSLPRSGPLADLRLYTGSEQVPSGTVSSIHNFPIPFRAVDPDAPMRLPETMSEPFIESGIMRPRNIDEIERQRILDSFNKLGATGRNQGWNPRTSTEIERRAVESILNDILPDYSGRFTTIPRTISSQPRSFGGGRDFMYQAQQSGWTSRATSPINTLVRRQIIEDISGNLGINPYLWSTTDIRTLENLRDAIEAGVPSSAMHLEGLDYLFREGVAPTATRVGRSGAGVDSYNELAPDRRLLRAATEYGNFGVPVRGGPELRPHYGFIDTSLNAPTFEGRDLFGYGTVRRYGPVVAQWSDEVRPQTSFTVGDSLNRMLNQGPQSLPRPLQNPSIQDVAFAGGYDLPNASYVETQMFGGPSIENLIGLRVAENYADDVARIAQRYGIDVPIETMPGAWERLR